ncbi:MAG: hypothetical protein CMJ78_24295 [Planctomycetaceae bacterium]|nr:hypothetical protein [Planctomycetaceae bacterium]
MKNVVRFSACLVLACLFLVDFPLSAADEEEPICRIAAVSNLYLTSLSKEELGPSRSFLLSTAPAGIERSVNVVNSLEPDALVVIGSLTWAGKKEGFEKAKSYLDRVKAPIYVAPGVNDRKGDGPQSVASLFQKNLVTDGFVNVKGVHLQFSTLLDTSSSAYQKAVDSMSKGLKQASGAKAVLLFEGPEMRAITDPKAASPLQKKYWQLIDDHSVAARLTAGHGHTVRYMDRLPIWSIPSSGWSYSPKFSVALITVYKSRVELTLVYGDDNPLQSITIPNPVAAERFPKAADDPVGIPTFSQDLKTKPELTFVQISDSQFDDDTLPRYSARYRYDEVMNKLAVQQVNRLNPPMVFMTGDLTNKNTEAEWTTFRQIYGQLKAPLYTMPGNHDTLYDRSKLNKETLGDLLEPGKKNWALADRLAGKAEADRTALYQHFVGRKPYYSVEKNGSVFLCLNTGVASVDAEQMKWLKAELERTKNAKHVFVLGHYPVLPAFGNSIQGHEAQEILLLLRKYRVAAYLSGHRHRYDYRMNDGVMHVLCDCLCWGEYRSFQIYHVHADRIVACWKPIFRADGNRPLYERVEFPEPRFRGK